MPDVCIFTKAVSYALDGNEFFSTEEIFKAKELLRIAEERADQLSHGEAPWTRATGLVVRGYVSKIDGSVQPYGLVVPPSYTPDRPHSWRVDAASPLPDGSWTAHFRKTGIRWAMAGDDSDALRKRHDLQGPIDDAFMDRFLMVNPTGPAMNEMVGHWTKSEEAHAIRLWRTQMRGDAPVKDDIAVTADDIASSNLILWGDPKSNKVLARMIDKLLVQ